MQHFICNFTEHDQRTEYLARK